MKTAPRFVFGLLIAVTAVSCKDKLRVAQPDLDEEETQGIKALESVGAKYERDDATKGRPIVWLSLWNTSVTDAGMKDVAKLKHLQTLDLHDTQITDASLKHLAELKELRKLDLEGTKITDNGIRELTGLVELRELTLLNTKVTMTGVNDLKKALPYCKIDRYKIISGP